MARRSTSSTAATRTRATATNAYGRCVSQKASGKTAQQQNAQINAAIKCRTAPLKDQIGVGTGKTYRNFGACVSAQTKLAWAESRRGAG